MNFAYIILFLLVVYYLNGVKAGSISRANLGHSFRYGVEHQPLLFSGDLRMKRQDPVPMATYNNTHKEHG